jgi:transcriptional regulator GlxA family with amidase domain
MSPFALLRAFRAETGLPPHAYLNQLRVRLARRCSTTAWHPPWSPPRRASPTRRT